MTNGLAETENRAKSKGSEFQSTSVSVEFSLASAGIQNMMLAAADIGPATLWFTFFRPEKLRAVLGFPENLEVAGVIPLGRPKETTKTPPRKDPKMHSQRYSPGS